MSKIKNWMEDHPMEKLSEMENEAHEVLCSREPEPKCDYCKLQNPYGSNYPIGYVPE